MNGRDKTAVHRPIAGPIVQCELRVIVSRAIKLANQDSQVNTPAALGGPAFWGPKSKSAHHGLGYDYLSPVTTPPPVTTPLQVTAPDVRVLIGESHQLETKLLEALSKVSSADYLV